MRAPGVLARIYHVQACYARNNMEKDMEDFVYQCLQCVDSKASNTISCHLGDFVRSAEVGKKLYIVCLNLEESKAISSMDDLVDGSN